MFKLDLTDLTKQHIARAKQFGSFISLAYQKSLYGIGDKNINEIKANSKTSGGQGRMYTRKVRGKSVRKRASAQGQFPISWRGILKRGNKFEVNNPRKLNLFNKVKYAFSVENKDPYSGGRPFMWPVIKKNETENRNIINKRVGETLDKL